MGRFTEPNRFPAGTAFFNFRGGDLFLTCQFSYVVLYPPVGISGHIQHYVVDDEAHTALPDFRRKRPRVPTDGNIVEAAL